MDDGSCSQDDCLPMTLKGYTELLEKTSGRLRGHPPLASPIARREMWASPVGPRGVSADGLYAAPGGDGDPRYQSVCDYANCDVDGEDGENGTDGAAGSCRGGGSVSNGMGALTTEARWTDPSSSGGGGGRNGCGGGGGGHSGGAYCEDRGGFFCGGASDLIYDQGTGGGGGGGGCGGGGGTAGVTGGSSLGVAATGSILELEGVHVEVGVGGDGGHGGHGGLGGAGGDGSVGDGDYCTHTGGSNYVCRGAPGIGGQGGPGGNGGGGAGGIGGSAFGIATTNTSTSWADLSFSGGEVGIGGAGGNGATGDGTAGATCSGGDGEDARDGVLVEMLELSPPLPFEDSFDFRRGWQVFDDGDFGGASNWHLAEVDGENVFVQSSNHFVGTHDAFELPGTQAVNGNSEWDNYSVTVRFFNPDNDGVGVIARFQDNDNYYRFALLNQVPSARLVAKIDGEYILLAEDLTHPGFAVGEWTWIRLVVDGDAIEAYISADGVTWDLVLSATEASVSRGRVGLFAWGSSGVMFDDLLVEQLL